MQQRDRDHTPEYRHNREQHRNWHPGQGEQEEYRDFSDRWQEPRPFFQRLRHTWDDIMHADDVEWQERDRRARDQYRQQHSSSSDRQRYGSEPYRDRNFDSGYEGGPRWADETDSGKK